MKSKQKPAGLWDMAARNLRRNPRRSFLSGLAIGVAAMTMVLMFALLEGIIYDLAVNIQRYLAGHVLVQARAAESEGEGPEATVGDLDSLRTALEDLGPGIVTAPRVQGGLSIFEDGDSYVFPFIGMDYSQDPMALDRFLKEGSLPTSGEREALITVELAQRLGMGLGDRITAMTQTVRGSSNGMTFTVTGLVEPNLGQYAGPYLFTSLETAQRLVRLTDGAHEILVLGPGGPGTGIGSGAQTAALDDLVAKSSAVVAASADQDLVARRWDQTNVTYSLLTMISAIYGFVGIFFFALASTVIVNTMLMVVLERSKEIGTLSALGMEPGKIRGLFLAESVLISSAGALGGTLVGLVLSLILQRTGIDFSAAMEGVDLEMSSVFRPIVTWVNPVMVMAGATGTALLATLLPTRRILGIKIVEALRGNP